MSKEKNKRKRDRARKKAEKEAKKVPLMNEKETESDIGKKPTNNSEEDSHGSQRSPRKPRVRGAICEWFSNGKSFTDWCIALFTFVLAGAAIFQFTIMGRQLDEMGAQRRLSIRPWVGLDDDLSQAIQNGPLWLDKDGNAGVSYNIMAKNYGSVPASNVWGAAMLVISDDLNVALERQDVACGDSMIGKKDIGMVLFQGKGRIFSGSMATSKVEIRYGENNVVWAWLVGCIGYRDQFGYLYRTAFRARMAGDKGTDIYWQGPPKGPLTATGRFVQEWGSIDSGRIPKL